MKVKPQHPRWNKLKPTVPQFENANIDAENGIIKDVVMCQVGPAKGHGVHIEESFLKKLVDYSSTNYAESGLKARFGHPALSDTTMGTQMGVFHNIRIREQQAIGDLHLLDSAESSPKFPGMKSWALKMAQERPDFMMSSIVFAEKVQYQYNDEGERVDLETNKYGEYIPEFGDREIFTEMESIHYCDMVEAGAATDNLFANQFHQDKFAIQVVDFVREKPELLNFLQKHPEKIGQFATKLGIEMPKPTYSFAEKFDALKGIFGTPEKTDTTALDAANVRITELEGELNTLKTTEPDTSALDAANARIAELESEVTKLKERVPEPTVFQPGDKSKKDVKELHPFTQIAIEKFNRRKQK